MKKYLSILILATFIGLLSPITNIHAQAIGGGNGTCSIAVITDSTNCTQQGGVWTPNSTSTSPGCHDNNGVPIPLTEDACKVAGYSWTDIPPASSPTDVQSTYKFLTPLPCDAGTIGCVNGQLTSFDPSQENALSGYLNLIIKILIGVAAVLAVIMIIMGGIEYMTSSLVSSKEAGKKRITDALIGLLIALMAYILLFTINPDLLKTIDASKIDTATITFTESPEIIVSDSQATAPGGICGKTIVVNGQNVTSCDDTEITTISFLGHQVQVNKAIVNQLNAINTAWLNSTDPAVKNYKITSIGCYNARSATGTSTTPSAHAFGLACDINPNSNPYSTNPSSCTTDIPKGLVTIFTNNGFGWGGYWKTKKDAMHFSASPNEAKYTSGSCS